MSRDMIVLHDGMTLYTHGPGQCAGKFCPVHNPSDHPLRDAPRGWNDELGYMLRVCEHGQFHADPDDWRVLLKHVLDVCDGCCRAQVIDGEAGFRCPRCGSVSWHPEDARQGYCRRCNAFTGKGNREIEGGFSDGRR